MIDNAKIGGIVVDADRTELFVRLLSKHRDDLFRYIFSLVPHEADAQDVLQEASVAICRKFDDYDPSKPFLAWANRFAFLEVLKFRDRIPRKIHSFSIELLELLAQERERHDPLLHTRLQALEICLKKLSTTDRKLIQERYHSGLSTEDLVEHSGTSRRTFFRQLDRIRRSLQECITRQVKTNEFI